MAELLLVRSGNADDRVTKRFEMTPGDLRRFIGSRQLHYLGATLSPIGETSRVSEFADPDHVVVCVDESETDKLSVDHHGFYVVEGTSPNDVGEPGDGE